VTGGARAAGGGRRSLRPTCRRGTLARVLALCASLVPLPASLALQACGGSDSGKYTDVRMWTDSLAFRISMDPLPPRANEPILYKIVVRDKDSGAPVEGGEGRIFAMSRDSVRTWDALEPGPELGTYYARLRFVTAGQWAVGMQFRRDSLHPIERMDWMQDVRVAR
jgi:hypothetical protein